MSDEIKDEEKPKKTAKKSAKKKAATSTGVLPNCCMVLFDDPGYDIKANHTGRNSIVIDALTASYPATYAIRTGDAPVKGESVYALGSGKAGERGLPRSKNAIEAVVAVAHLNGEKLLSVVGKNSREYRKALKKEIARKGFGEIKVG